MNGRQLREQLIADVTALGTLCDAAGGEAWVSWDWTSGATGVPDARVCVVDPGVGWGPYIVGDVEDGTTGLTAARAAHIAAHDPETMSAWWRGLREVLRVADPDGWIVRMFADAVLAGPAEVTAR